MKKPERHASRRLSDYLTFEGQKQKVHSLVNQVGQPCLIDPFSPDLAKPFMKAESGMWRSNLCGVQLRHPCAAAGNRLRTPHNKLAIERVGIPSGPAARAIA